MMVGSSLQSEPCWPRKGTGRTGTLVVPRAVGQKCLEYGHAQHIYQLKVGRKGTGKKQAAPAGAGIVKGSLVADLPCFGL